MLLVPSIFEKYKALGTLEEMGLPSDSEGGQVFKGLSCQMAWSNLMGKNPYDFSKALVL